MRLFLLTLMIALLPLRGWVGDAMASKHSIAEQQAVLATSVQDKCHERHQHDAHEEARTADTTQAEEDCGNCTACQICHGLALTAQPPLEQPRLRQPPDLTRLHISADPHPGLRPPIVQA